MKDEQKNFFELSPTKILDAVEASMALEKPGVLATGRAIALNSLENRVYQIEFEDSSEVVAKFYRPGRWSEDQILDEHEFLDILKEQEIPVVSPHSLASSSLYFDSQNDTLMKMKDGIFFAVFPRVRGRLRDELKDSQLETLGRYLARVHELGNSWRAEHRQSIDSDFYLKDPLIELERSGFLNTAMGKRYFQMAEDFYKAARPRLRAAPKVTLHGDCHLGNVLWNDESAFLMDFDDMMLAPRVQDLWMVVRGRDETALKAREAFIRGYEQMSSFPFEELSLIECLRGVRVIYYSSWIAKRWADPAFPLAFPSFGSETYWRSEIEALSEILELL